MVGFWIFKFIRNEDVSSIEYISYDSNMDVAYPGLSICVLRPFIYQNLRVHSGGNVSVEDYERYIRGDTMFLEEYAEINFENVTLNLLDYVKEVEVLMKNGTWLGWKYLEACQYVRLTNIFNGFLNRISSRCFGFDMILKSSGYVEALYVSFRQELIYMLEKIHHHSFGSTALLLNYPGQIVQYMGLFETIWTEPSNSVGMLSIKATSMEILRRRNKKRNPCLVEWMRFDDVILKKHHDTVGCSPPYHKSDKSVCKTSAEMRDSIYEMSEVGSKYHSVPCEEMSNIAFKAHKVPGSRVSEYPQLYFEYPHRAKVIQQLKSVDLHSLIGNIGGYIGLFLGNTRSI